MNRLLVFGILLAAAGAVGVLLTFPEYQKLQAQRSEVKEREQELENRETYFADLKEVKKELKGFSTQIAKIGAAIPSDPQLPVLYEFLQQTAASSGVVLRSISSSIGGSAGETALKTVPITLELTGSYESFKEFIMQIQSASRMMTVQGVGLGLSGSEEPDVFTINLQLTAYSY